jgi:hypothetical protein
MTDYFDKDFFKFLMGFAAIILLSCVLIIAARLYQSEQDSDHNAVTNIAKPEP